jgi:hypothetical protein
VRVTPIAALAAAAVIAGCGGSDGKQSRAGVAGGDTPRRSVSPTVPPAPADSGKGVVQRWTRAIYKGRYRQAAALFARDAVVEQSITLILHTRADALVFNRSLPCRAKVTSIKREPDGRLLAAFDLFARSDGQCQRGGKARVRFRIRGGKIKEWRQLPEPPEAPSQSA